MRINADFDKPALSLAADREWIPSPLPGVDRQMLDRVGEEVARATSLVRYDKGSSFSAHTHDLGEEFLVLDGTFGDEHGDYPAGTYVRNPPGTAHTPRVEDGCTIFVKLRQFDLEDQKQFSVNISDESQWADIGGGTRTLPLHRYGSEDVFVVSLDGGATLTRSLPGGAELLVLEGSLQARAIGDGNQDTALQALGWLRLPTGASLDLEAGPNGVRFYLKTGHLAQ